MLKYIITIPVVGICLAITMVCNNYMDRLDISRNGEVIQHVYVEPTTPMCRNIHQIRTDVEIRADRYNVDRPSQSEIELQIMREMISEIPETNCRLG